MTMPAVVSPSRILLGAALVAVLAAAGPARAQPAPSQEGLPAELVINAESASDEQLRLHALHAAGLAAIPKPGILDSIKSMFAGGEKAQYVPVPDLIELVGQFRGRLVQTEGIHAAGEERGTLRALGAELAVELVGGTVPQGFEIVQGDPDGQPVLVSGRIETQGDVVLLRAESMVPSAMLAGVRIGRICEQQERWQEAVKAYEEVLRNGALTSRPWAPFARIRAGQIALEKLGDKKKARAQFSSAWQPYTVERNGRPLYHTWVPVSGNGWEKLPVAEALAPRLDRLNSETLAYKIVDLFVRMAGNSPAFGVLLMAIVVRLAILPLTRKQMESQRRMQAIQPQIKELQQKYATDKQKFQEEFWKLCQQNNCNPLGGCLPMLIQMPILIFLYRGIRDYIVQFDGAGFLWVGNLAQPDLLMLVLYTLSMVAFQKMAAQSQPTVDPQQAQQQKMMAYMMPLMFFFFFQSFPAAFILYWLGSNVIYFGEQFLYMRRTSPQGVQAQPAGEQRGGGLVGAILRAARGAGRDSAPDQEHPPSYEEKRKQGKKRKRGRG